MEASVTLQARPLRRDVEVSERLQTSLNIRRNLRIRRGRLEQSCPKALDIAADVLLSLHAALDGRHEALRGDKSGAVLRRMTMGDKPVAVEDLARLALEAPTAARPAVARLARELGERLAPVEPSLAPVHESAARTFERAGGLAASLVRALSDGSISREEAEALLPEVTALARQAVQLEAQLVRVAF